MGNKGLDTIVRNQGFLTRLGSKAQRTIYTLPLISLLTLEPGCATMASSRMSTKETCETRLTSSTLDKEGEELVNNVKDYVCARLVTKDSFQESSTFRKLKDYLISSHNIKTKKEEDFLHMDIVTLSRLNRYLTQKGLFLFTFSNVVSIYDIYSKDIFDGFIVDGKKQNTVFGKEIGSYERIMLRDRLFSTHDVDFYGVHYKIGDSWFIAIPYKEIQHRQISDGKEAIDRLAEALTMHEIGHIIAMKGGEFIPFLVQFGYRMDADKRIRNIDDMMDYLNTKTPTYHPAQRIALKSIYDGMGTDTHRSTLQEIRNGLIELTNEIHNKDPKYPSDPLKISDQQSYAIMELLYHKHMEKR